MSSRVDMLGKLSVIFKSNTDRSRAIAALQDLELTFQVCIWDEDGTRVILVDVPEGQEDNLIERLRELQDVEVVHKPAMRIPFSG